MKMKILYCILILFWFYSDSYSQIIPLTRKESFNIPNLNNKLIMGSNGPYVDLTNFLNVQYFGTVYVGTPRQKFTVLFDTGSDFTWIPGPNDTSFCGTNHAKFDPTHSRSCINLNREIPMYYGKGNAVADLINETVTIGDLTISNQQMGITKTGDCQNNQFDGIMGMSLPSPDRPDIIPVFRNMIKQQVVPSPMFSFYFNRNGNEEKGGELYLGGYNTKYIKESQIKFLPIFDGSYWQIAVKSVHFGSRLISSNVRATLDTGVSSIVIPRVYMDRIQDAIKGVYMLPYLTIQCADLNYVPALVFNINGKDYSITAQELFQYNDSGLCYLNLQVQLSDMGPENDWVLGYPFLSTVYSVFDYANRKVALVPLRSDISPSEPTLPPMTTPKTNGASSLISNLAASYLGLVIILNFSI